jgi:hypothetical protein
LSYEDQEYHRRRSEIELEQAVSTDDPASAAAHFELARMHRARRQIIAQNHLKQLVKGNDGCRLFGTDKEA